jgi:hypothetical protein
MLDIGAGAWVMMMCMGLVLSSNVVKNSRSSLWCEHQTIDHSFRGFLKTMTILFQNWEVCDNIFKVLVLACTSVFEKNLIHLDIIKKASLLLLTILVLYSTKLVILFRYFMVLCLNHSIFTRWTTLIFSNTYKLNDRGAKVCFVLPPSLWCIESQGVEIT